jgi:hypothetical protein
MSPLSRRPTARAIAAALVAILVLGCASGGRSASDRTKPPVLLGNMRPDWRYPAAPRTGTVLSLQIEVQVDSVGQADPATVRVTGLGAAENAEVVRSWLQSARFTPAQREGKPVAGVYHTRVEVRATVRRVGTRDAAARPLG